VRNAFERHLGKSLQLPNENHITFDEGLKLPTMTDTDLELLERISRRVLWLSTYMLHYANHVRPNPDGTKVDGHPHALSFIGSVFGAPTIALGVDSYGQSGTRQELYDHYGIGLAAMQRAVLASIQNEQS